MVRTILVLFLSSRNAAYSSLLEKKQYSDPNRKILEKMLVGVPFVGGGTAGPKK